MVRIASFDWDSVLLQDWKVGSWHKIADRRILEIEGEINLIKLKEYTN